MKPFLNWFARVGGTFYVATSLIITFKIATLRRLMRVNSAFDADKIVDNFSHMDDMFYHAAVAPKSQRPCALRADPAPLPDAFTFRGQTLTLDDWRASRAVTAMIVLRDGKIAFEDYYLDTAREDQRISWSMAKSFLSATFGIAVGEGLLGSLDDLVTEHVPHLKDSAYNGVTVRHVLNMSSGVAFNEDYLDYHSDINRMGRVLALGHSMDGFACSLKKRAYDPGSRLKYVSIDTHVIGMVLRKITGQSARAYMGQKLLKPMGLEYDSYFLTDGDGVDFVLGGLNLATRDYARFGLLMACDGKYNGQQIVPSDWVRQSTVDTAPPPAEDMAPTDEGLLRYGYQWWLPPDAEQGEFFAIGIYGQYIYVNRPRKTVIAVNAANRDFKVGLGAVTLANLALYREIAHQDGR